MSLEFSQQSYELDTFEMNQRLAWAEHERMCLALMAGQPGPMERARIAVGRLLIQLGTRLATSHAPSAEVPAAS
jgi:hypothetical protein